MLLCIDVGNTHATLGLFTGDELGPTWRLASSHDRTADEYGLQVLGLLSHARVPPGSIEGVAIASVVPPLTATWFDVAVRYLGRPPLVVDAGVRTGVKIRYDDPRSVGADRVVDAAAAHRLYGGPACVVDFGTATTFDAISQGGEYLGGAIAPGLGIALDALCSRTAKLPRVEVIRPPAVIGKSTVHSMQSGILYGYVGLVEGMVARFRAELGNEMKVIGTGGYLDLLARETQVFDVLAPSLTLEGLRLIWEMNRDEGEERPRAKGPGRR